MTLRLATWNLDHASNSKRPIDLQVKTILGLNPDILVLTETCKEVDAALVQSGYQSYPSEPNQYGKFFSVIYLGQRVSWVETLPTAEAICSVCVRVNTQVGEMIIYGTIITYHGDKGRDLSNPSPAWHEHYRSIKRHGDDWFKLSGSVPVIIAGDFNQTRDGSAGTYGTVEGRKLLTDELARSNLVCLTTENFGATGKLIIDPGKGFPRNNIDHICMTHDAYKVEFVGAWDHFVSEAGVVTYLSDHNGVYVDLENIPQTIDDFSMSL